MNRFIRPALWILFAAIAISILVSIGSSIGRGQAEDEYRIYIAQLEESKKGLQRISDSLQTRAIALTTDLRTALDGNTQLKSHVRMLERELDVRVTEIEVLEAVRDTLLATGIGEVITDSLGGTILVRKDTLGVHVNVAVDYPDGRYKLRVAHDPIKMIITATETPEGIVAKQVKFPGQPWIELSEWEILIERAPPKRPGFMEKIFGNLRKLGFTIGGSLGKEPTVMGAIAIGDMQVGVDSRQSIVILKTIRLLE